MGGRREPAATRRTWRAVPTERNLGGGRLQRPGWLNGKLRLRADCGLQQGLPPWEKLPLSHESLLESGARAKQASCTLPSLAPPPQAALQHSKVALPWWIPKAPPPYNLTRAPWQIGPKRKNSKTPERELRGEEIANLSDGEFNLVIKMF